MRMVPLLPPHMRLLAPPRVSLWHARQLAFTPFRRSLGGNRMMWRPRPPPDQHLAGDTLGLLPAFAVGEGCTTRRGRGVIVHTCAGGMPAVDLRPLHLPIWRVEGLGACLDLCARLADRPPLEWNGYGCLVGIRFVSMK